MECTEKKRICQAGIGGAEQNIQFIKFQIHSTFKLNFKHSRSATAYCGLHLFSCKHIRLSGNDLCHGPGN